MEENPYRARIEHIKSLREAGLTLDAIGKEFGLGRERIRQILVQHYGTTDPSVPFLTTRDLRLALNCSSDNLIHSLHSKGVITPLAVNRWPVSTLEAIKDLRKCKLCGKSVEKGRVSYCSEACYLQSIRARYSKWSDEQKQLHRTRVKRWKQSHPERSREIDRKAHKRWKQSHPEQAREAQRRAYQVKRQKEISRVEC